MKELSLIFESTTPQLKHNFEDCKAVLEEGLEEYKAVNVTEENLKDSKKLVTELNKSVKFLEDRRKAVKEDILAPYKDLEPKVKELVGMINEAIDTIKDQVKTYEDARLAICEALLDGALEHRYRESGVEPEFYTADIKPLVKLSHLTGKDCLTKSATETVKALVAIDKARQEKHTARIMQVENMCLKAGIQPLTQVTFSHCLDEDTDDVFSYKIQSIIDGEIQRQKAIEESVRKKEKPEKEAQPEKEPEVKQQIVVDEAKTQIYKVTIVTRVQTDNPAGLSDRIRKEFNLDADASIQVVPE